MTKPPGTNRALRIRRVIAAACITFGALLMLIALVLELLAWVVKPTPPKTSCCRLATS
jgi:hypothetical protein